MNDKERQTRTSSSAKGRTEQEPDPAGKVPSRGEVINNILNYSYEKQDIEGPGNNEYELRRLVQAILNLEGHFGLLLAVCNSAAERESLTQQIIDKLPYQKPTIIRLSQGSSSLLETLLSAPETLAPLIVLGIEKLLPSSQ